MKRRRIGQCIYCLREAVVLTDDHVFPSSWYPETTPPNLKKWKVPACSPCNRNYGRIENDLLVRLALCLKKPKNPDVAGLAEKALRSINPKFAKTLKDRLARQRRREKIFGEMRLVDPADMVYALPGFGVEPGVNTAGLILLQIPEAPLKAFATKQIRGTTYVYERRAIPPAYAIKIFFPWEDKIPDLIARIKTAGKTESRGPGFTISRAVAADRPDWSITRIEIWGQLRIAGMVMSADEPVLKDDEEEGEKE